MIKELPKIKLKIFTGEKFLTEEVFQQKIIHIGKLSTSHLKIMDDNVSRQHSVIEVLGSGEILITDLESTNGTWVNNVQITQTSLKNGDELVIGKSRIIVEIEGDLSESGLIEERFYERPTYKEKEEGTGRYALEVVTLWKNDILHIRHFMESQNVTIGEQAKSSIFLPEELLGAREYNLVNYSDGIFLLNLKNRNFTGDCLLDNKIYSLDELKKEGKLEDRYFLEIDTDTKCRLRLGDFIFLISMSVLPKPVPVRRKWNVQDYLFTGLSLTAHILFLILINLIPEEQLRTVIDPYKPEMLPFKVVQLEEMEKTAEDHLSKEDGKNNQICEKELAYTDELASKLTPVEKIPADSGRTKIIGSRGTGKSRYYSNFDPFSGASGQGTGGFRISPPWMQKSGNSEIFK
jgi:pSer/pThr/pTyr-binding forkhead associated (FHA) protein